MEFDWLSIALAILAVWRVTNLLHAENGPWDSLHRLRQWADSKGAGSVFGCFYCLSLWVSAPFSALLSREWPKGLLLWLGLSGAAILLERVTQPPVAAHPVWWKEEDPEKESDVVLRK